MTDYVNILLVSLASFDSPILLSWTNISSGEGVKSTFLSWTNISLGEGQLSWVGQT